MHNLKQLKIWQLSIELADCVYNATEHFPSTETYGLRDQMRRAAVSVGSNIAEGAGRNSPKEFEHFIGIANGSLNELIFQFELCKRRNLVRIEQHLEIEEKIDHLLRMNYQFKLQLKKSQVASHNSQIVHRKS